MPSVVDQRVGCRAIPQVGDDQAATVAYAYDLDGNITATTYPASPPGP